MAKLWPTAPKKETHEKRFLGIKNEADTLKGAPGDTQRETLQEKETLEKSKRFLGNTREKKRFQKRKQREMPKGPCAPPFTLNTVWQKFLC